MNHSNLILKTPDGRTHTVCCRGILRRIEGRRTVFDGICADRGVIVKRFEDVFGPFRCRREKRGLERLAERGLAVPKVLLAGKDADGQAVLVIEKIDGAVDVRSALNTAVSEEAAKTILFALFRYVARMHQAGVIQNDLHPGNFLVSGSDIYAIDPAWMRFRKTPAAEGASRGQLAILSAGLGPQHAAWRAELLEAYCEERGIPYTSEMLEGVRRRAAAFHKKKLPHALKKTLRNCTAFLVVQRQNVRAVFSRQAFSDHQAEALIGVIEAIDASKDRIHTVTLEGQRFEAELFCAGGVWQKLQSRLFGSLARRQWLAEWRAHYRGKNARPPLALIEWRYGLLGGRSCVIRES